MAFGRDAGTAGSVHGDGDFRKESFGQQCVGNHTDIRAQADQFDFPDMAVITPGKGQGQIRRTKSIFFINRIIVSGDEFLKGGMQFPALRFFDTVGDGRCFPSWVSR